LLHIIVVIVGVQRWSQPSECTKINEQLPMHLTFHDPSGHEQLHDSTDKKLMPENELMTVRLQVHENVHESMNADMTTHNQLSSSSDITEHELMTESVAVQ